MPLSPASGYNRLCTPIYGITVGIPQTIIDIAVAAKPYSYRTWHKGSAYWIKCVHVSPRQLAVYTYNDIDVLFQVYDNLLFSELAQLRQEHGMAVLHSDGSQSDANWCHWTILILLWSSSPLRMSSTELRSVLKYLNTIPVRSMLYISVCVFECMHESMVYQIVTLPMYSNVRKTRRIICLY